MSTPAERATPPDLCLPWLEGRVTGPDGPLAIDAWRETHTCCVLLSADRAYKVRKPVDLGFLDYASPAARRRWTAEELALGRRVSPHIHHGMWWLRRSGDLVPDAGKAVRDAEPVLVMSRLPEELCAARVMAARDAGCERLDPAIADCVRFHEEAPVDMSPEGRGSVANTIRAWKVNFEQMPPDAHLLPLRPPERAHLEEETQDWLDELWPVLAARIADGRIREGHGDLRLEHVYLTEPWSVIDPLEFELGLRFCDVAAEVGFLAMELDGLGRADASAHLVERYSELAVDDLIFDVMPFFKRYRAVVRAKVEWIRACQVEGEAREAHLARSRELFDLALAYAT
jgi:aminoglycoside phosphotransferase family enzyme